MTRFNDKELPSKCQDMTDLHCSGNAAVCGGRQVCWYWCSIILCGSGRVRVKEAFCIDLQIEVVVRCYFRGWKPPPPCSLGKRFEEAE